MTTEIPNRPSAPLGMAWAAHYAHQEAVARVAVEALRELACEWDYQAEKFIENCKRAGCARCEALARIEASGWLP